MMHVKDLRWKKGITVDELVKSLGTVGFQSIEMKRASDAITKMKKEGAKIFFTFTSNMVTSGLRGLFAQVIELGLSDVIVTTAGAIEEDIMKAKGEKFIIGSFNQDDVSLYEKGCNRVGNLYITNESYMNFENTMLPILNDLYKKNPRWSVSDMLYEIGLTLDDESSILYQAAKRKIPVFVPAITDGSIGFHLFLFQQKHPDFVIDTVRDFKQILTAVSHDEKKGVVALGGSVSKHFAILAALLNGGMDYAVYMTTAKSSSGSLSGATTQEAKSWGKIKCDSDAATVNGDVTITFPLVIMHALENLQKEGIIKC